MKIKEFLELFSGRTEKVLLSFILLFCIFKSYQAVYFKGFSEGFKEKESQQKEAIKSFSVVTLWQLINDFREENDLPRLKEDVKLCEFANQRAKEIVTDFSHDAFEKQTNLIYSKYCSTCSQMGENLAQNINDADALLLSWRASPPHLKALLTPYTIGCLGIHEENNIFFVALEMAKK